MMDLDIINSMSMKVVYCILLFFKNRHFTTTVDSERQGLDSKFGCQRVKLLIYLSGIVFYPKWDFLLSNWEVYNPFSCWTPREKAPLPSLWGLPGPQQPTELREPIRCHFTNTQICFNFTFAYLSCKKSPSIHKKGYLEQTNRMALSKSASPSQGFSTWKGFTIIVFPFLTQEIELLSNR